MPSIICTASKASLVACFLLLGAIAHGTTAEPSVVASDGLQKDPAITGPRICAALAVYELADADDWGLRATVANTALNAYRDSSHVPDCSAGIADALASSFQPARWQLAIDAVDAVLSGSYQISPEACVRANMIIPLHAAESKDLITSPVLVKAHCVMSELAFVEVIP